MMSVVLLLTSDVSVVSVVSVVLLPSISSYNSLVSLVPLLIALYIDYLSIVYIKLGAISYPIEYILIPRYSGEIVIPKIDLLYFS